MNYVNSNMLRGTQKHVTRGLLIFLFLMFVTQLPSGDSKIICLLLNRISRERDINTETSKTTLFEMRLRQETPSKGEKHVTNPNSQYS